ncbi:amino acid ABC transporter substrate-binding protein [Planctomycetales bacterium]|nr:amino acid ABC transporter substrate-binding protein [Planctomycetales bacterium]GHV21488.1 amino acid ABC transporter substrate-binding protein [Planctomycetales bacterium]
MKKYFWALVALTLWFAGYAAGGDGSLDRVKTRGLLRVGILADTYPFGYFEQGKYRGFEVNLARQLAKDLLGDENKIELVPVHHADRIVYLHAGLFDVLLASLTVTPERAKLVAFALPYLRVRLGVLSPKKKPIKSLAELADQDLIVNSGTTAEKYFSRECPQARLRRYVDFEDSFEALKQGEGAALAQDNLMLYPLAERNHEFIVSLDDLGETEVIAPAVRLGEKDLLDWLNDEIRNRLGGHFFHDNFDATLRSAFGDDIDPDAVVIERGEAR